MKRTSMRVPIPEEMREKLAADPFMKRCVIAGKDECEGVIQWHHAFAYAGKRVNEIWAIQPLCEKHHREEAKWRERITFWLKQRISHFGAWYDVQTKYPKAIWR